MKALLINVVCGIRSTGRICTDLAKELEKQGYEVKIAYGREAVPEEYQKYAIRIGTDWDNRFHGVLTRLFDIHGTGPASRSATRKFLQWAEEYDPNLLWLHNLHGYYLNYELLFTWIKEAQMKRQEAGKPLMEIRWTLHDCWAFTGHCTQFIAMDCRKWRAEEQTTGDADSASDKLGISSCCSVPCPEKRSYPSCLGISSAADNYHRKQTAFTGVPNLRIITPSKWLAGLVKQSFLQDYSVEVVYNKIDTTVFKPTPSSIKDRLGITGKKMLLGASTAWSEKKGLFDYVRLAEMLDDSYVIVLVGLDPQDKQAKAIRKRMTPADSRRLVFMPETNNPHELAELYTAADVFINLTHEDNYPTVNLEAEACGTRVITYDVGGCRETIKREDSVVVTNMNELGNDIFGEKGASNQHEMEILAT